MDFYKRLNYSLGNEDWSVEEQALSVKSGDHVLCVTASGDRPLDLLTTECEEVTAIDLNRSQTYLLDLKIAALTHFDYEKYLAFLGCVPSEHRYSMFKEIKFLLQDESALFWQHHKKMIERGVIYQGKIERLTQVAAKIFKACRGKNIERLFSFNNLDEQREFVNKVWDRFLLRKIFDVLLSPKLVKIVSNDPGLNDYVDHSIHPGKYIYQRMLDYLHNHLANKSVLLQLVVLGRILPEAYFPYLTFSGFEKIRTNTHRLKFRTDNIIEFLHRNEGYCLDVFSMSDIASYMPQAAFERMLEGIYYAAKPNARFCVREFMSKRQVPNHLTERLVRNPLLEKKLEREETNFVYRFVVGKVAK